MTHELLVTAVCGSAYLVAGVAAYPLARHRAWWPPLMLRTAAAVAVGLDFSYLFISITRGGMVDTFERGFDAILLLATLIGVVGLATHFAPKLRGLDGLLFLAAGVIQFSDLTILGETGAPTGRPWFISHGLAFALSAVFFIAGGVAGIAYLLATRMLRQKRLWLLQGVAPLESLERFGRWMPIIGFPLFTFGILTGLCGVAHRGFFGTRAWYLDPTFVFSIVAWGVYAYLAVSLMYRPWIRGRRAAMLAACGLGLVVVAFLAREFVSPLHQ
jgi:ABC-type uncharacterized transport system permease subunit